MASKYTRCHVHYTMERSLAFQGKVRPPPKIVLLVSDYSLFGVRAAIKAPGVMGIVDKESSGVSILLEALKQVQEGGDFYTPAIARKAIDVVLHDHELELTLREETALRKLAETGSIAGAAQKLGGNTGTTYNYFSSIRRKFGLSHNANAQAIVAQAHELGYIQQKPKG